MKKITMKLALMLLAIVFLAGCGTTVVRKDSKSKVLSEEPVVGSDAAIHGK